MKGVHVVGGWARECGRQKFPSRGPGDEVAQKVKQNVLLVYNF